MNDELWYCHYRHACIVLPAAVMIVIILTAVDCLSRKKVTTPLSYLDYPYSSDDVTQVIQQRCLWYQVHVAHISDAHFLFNNSFNDSTTNWRLLKTTVHSGLVDAEDPRCTFNVWLWKIINCCLIRLHETPRFLHEHYPQPRSVLHAFLLHSSPLLVFFKSLNTAESKNYLCCRLESLLLLLGVAKIHESGCYSVRRLVVRDNIPSRASDHTIVSSWRFSFWIFLRKQYHQQIDAMLFPSLALHLGLHPSLSLQLLSESNVVDSYLNSSVSRIDASRRFVADLSDSTAQWGILREKALCCLRQFHVALMETVPRRRCDEIPALCDEENHQHIQKIIRLHRRPYSDNVDFIEAQALVASTYLALGAFKQGSELLEGVCEHLNEEIPKAITVLSHSLRSLALVAWARSDVKQRHARCETSDPLQKPETGRLVGEQLFSIHLQLKSSPSQSTLLATAAPLCGAMSSWKEEFSQKLVPPCWESCQNEIKSLLQLSGIGCQTFDAIYTHFFHDSTNERQRSEFETIFSCLSQTCI